MGITLWQYYRSLTRRMADAALADVDSLDRWQSRRRQIYQQYMHSMGLDPLPPACDLQTSEHGQFAGPGYRATKLSFQFLPHCWSTAHLYLPDPPGGKRLPAILYQCGHAASGVVYYADHGARWAKRGYACLVLDTIQQHDDDATHHGIADHQRYDWLSLGYTPAGGELLSAMRAIDLLTTLPEIDPQRVAATGLSGGGAMSHYLALADPRVKAFAACCGVSDPYSAVDLRIQRHCCECTYYYNLYSRDTAVYAALAAPRPAMFCFAEGDGLFDRNQYIPMVERVKNIYRLHSCEDHCRLYEYPGPHAYQPQLERAIDDWFDEHVAGQPHPYVDRQPLPHDNATLTICNSELASPNRLDKLPQLLARSGDIELPRQSSAWPRIRDHALQTLRDRVFIRHGQTDETLDPRHVGDWFINDDQTTTLRKYHCQIAGMDLWIECRGPTEPSEQVIVVVADRDENAFETSARIGPFVADRTILRIEPRGCGFTGYHPKQERYYTRAAAVAGLTHTQLMTEDLQHALAYARTLDYITNRPIYLYAKADAAVACLYHGLFDQTVAGLVLDQLPASHRDGGHLLAILPVMDIQHALALAAPRPLALVNSTLPNDCFAHRIYKLLDCPQNLVQTADLQQAFDHVLQSANADRTAEKH